MVSGLAEFSFTSFDTQPGLGLFAVTLNRLTDFWRLLTRQVLRRGLVDHKRNVTQSSEREVQIK